MRSPVHAGALRYRAEIDGLRAAAVVPVVFYHYGVPGFGGGFVGVDIFFVISGYLITSLIHSEMATGRFSLLNFYERRARRILPALFAIIAVSLVGGIVLLFPRDLIELAESAAATSVFVGNFDFWLQSGYFDTSAALKPLLHTWSLAVEEQFYLLFPALLLLLHARMRSTLLVVVSVLAVISFALSVWAVVSHPAAAFYLAPFRIWELMLGAILALGAFAVPRSGILRDALILAGFALIAWPVAALTASTSFPGAAALPPCLGAALVIYASGGGASLFSRLLASAPLAGLGLVSYSLYLWHWPLLVFSQNALARPLTAAETGLLLFALVPVAVSSWRFIELPFRRKSDAIPRKTVFFLSATATAASVTCAVLLFAAGGFPERYSPAVQRALAEAADFEPRRRGCFNITADRVARGDYCETGDPNASTRSFLLWGDSHADAILPAVSAAARRLHRKGVTIAHGLCPPLLDVGLSDEQEGACASLNAEALRVASAPEINTVILAARWPYYAEGTGYGVDQSEKHRLFDLARPNSALSDQRVLFSRLLERTVRLLNGRGKNVVLVAAAPEPGVSVPEAYAGAILRGRDGDFFLSLAAYRARQQGVIAVLASLKRESPFTLVDPAQALCTSRQCDLERRGRPLYTDHQHLSVFGAEQLEPAFEEALQRESPGGSQNHSAPTF